MEGLMYIYSLLTNFYVSTQSPFNRMVSLKSMDSTVCYLSFSSMTQNNPTFHLNTVCNTMYREFCS